MKIYIDFTKQCITKIEGTTVYEGDIFSNVFELLFYNYGNNTSWFPTISQLAPNGRSAGDFAPDPLGEGETYEYIENDVTYLKYSFTMGQGWANMDGKNQFYIWVNTVSPMTRKGVGKYNVIINHSTNTFYVQDPLFNPAVKHYIDSEIDAIEANLGDGSPKYFDTDANIQAQTEDKGLAVATDTGKLYYWDNDAEEYTYSGVIYNNLSNYYTKTQSDTTFAPKSTAITHTGNQLQDYSGNNVYPNLSDGQVNTSNLADGCVTQQKLETKLSILVDKAYNKKTTSKTINCYVDDKDNFSSFTGPNQYWGYNNSIPKNTYIKSISFRCYANSKLIFYLCSLSGSTYTIEKTISEATYNNSNNAINIGYFTDDKEIYIIVGGSANGGGIYYSSATNGIGKLVNYTKSSDTFAVSQNLNKWQYAISYDFNVFIEPNSVIKVAQDGTGDYKTINEALTYAYTIESVNNPITIIIYPGVYKEVCNVKGTHFVSLVGVNRDTCIIRDDTGIYNNCPLRIEGASYIGNLTLIATHSETNDFVIDGELQYNASYALHIDDRHADNDNDYRVTVFNCRCYSEQNPAVGVGLDKNTTLELIQCEFERNETVTITSVKSGVWGYKADGGAFFYHALYSGNYTDDNGYQRMTVKDCVLKNNKNYAIYGESGGMMTQVTTTFINNVGYSASGFTAHRLSQETLSPLSFGNNMTSLNYTE